MTPPPQPRGLKGWVKDTGAGLMGGAAGLVKTTGELGGLATGNMDNAVTRLGDNAQQYWEDAKSDDLKARIQARKQDIDAQPSTLGKAWTAVKDTVTDPGLALDTVAGNAATMIPGMAVGRGVAAARAASAMAGARGFTTAAARQAAEEAAAKSAGTWGTRSAIGAAGVQQGADVSQQAYDDAMAKPESVWDANPDFQAELRANGGDRNAAKQAIATQSARATFAPATGISLAANAIPGADYLERALVGGAAREAVKDGVKYAMPKAIIKGALGEGSQEVLEEGGGQFAANVANRAYVDPNQDLSQDVGENAGMGFVGGALMGGASGPFHAGHEAAHQPGTEAPPEQTDLPPTDQPQTDSGPAGELPYDRLAGQTFTHPDGSVSTGADAIAARMTPFRPQTESQAMGLNPDAGPLSQAATIAVDSGAHAQTIQDSVDQVAAEVADKQSVQAAQPDLDERAARVADIADRLNYLQGQASINGGWTPLMAQQRNALRTELAQLREQNASGVTLATAAPQSAFDFAAPAAPTEQPGEPSNAQATQAQQTKAQRPQAGAAPRGVPGNDAGTAQASRSQGAGAVSAGAESGVSRRAQIEAAGIAWDAMSRAERKGVLKQAQGIGPAQRTLAHGGKWENLPADLQGHLADVIAPPQAQAVTEAAHEAATSPKNDLPEPTEAQKEAGNYRKGHVSINGLDISIENPAGSKRRPEWPALKNHYGYIRGSVGADKDHVDVFMTDRAHDPALPVFVVDQANKDGSFDEHKVILGAASEAEARKTYLGNYSKGWTGLRGITQMTQEQFKEWVKDPAKTKKPAAPQSVQEGMRQVQARKKAAADNAQPQSSTAPDAVPEFTTLKDVYGETVTVRTADLNGDAPLLRTFTKDGKPRAVRVHRDNLDATGEKRAAQAAENADNPLMNVITKQDSTPFASAPAAARELSKRGLSETHEVAQASTVQAGAQGFVIRRKAAAVPPSSTMPDEEFNANLPAYVAQYRALAAKEAGNPDYYATDLAKELFPEYGTSIEAKRDNNDAVQPRASKIAFAAFKARLAQPVTKDDGVVTLMAGGPGSGKTTMRPKERGIIYDSTSSDLTAARRNVKMVLDSGRGVEYRYVFTQPEGAFRAAIVRGQQEAGRQVNMKPMVGAHEGAYKVVQELQNEYAGDKRVQFYMFDNTGFARKEVESLPHYDYNGLRERLTNILDQEHAAGRVSEAEYRAIAGTDPGNDSWVRASGEGSRTSQDSRPEQSQGLVEPSTVKDSLTVAPEASASISANSRDSFTLERLNPDANRLEPVTFTRGEYVEVTLVGSGGKSYGEIDGISQARREFSVDGLWHPMGAAYKTERPEAPKVATVPLSSVIDKVNAKHGEGLTEADRVPPPKSVKEGIERLQAKKAAEKKAEATQKVDAHEALMAAVRAGAATPEQFKASFEAVLADKDAIKAELAGKTKAELLRDGGGWMRMRYANEKKDAIIDAFYREMVGEYALGETFSHGMGKGAYESAVRKLVESTDADKLAQYAKDRKAAVEEAVASDAARAAGLENPKTLNDFRNLLNQHIRQHGETRQQAYLRLTPEQRQRYDELEAEQSKADREARKQALRAQGVQSAGQTTTGNIIETKHTKHGHDLFVVQLAERVDREDYDTLNASARRLGGSYSSYRGNGAVPGFQFRTREAAEAFNKLVAGDAADAQAVAQARRDAFEDDRSQSGAERLRTMADALGERSSAALSQDRKTNTERRARMASSAEASARADQALAGTMRNIADAIDEGNAKYLDAVRQKVQVEYLSQVLRTAKDEQLRAKYPSYGDYEVHRGEAVDGETVDFAKFPNFTAMRSDLADLGRKLLEVDGAKKLGQKLMSVADDVTDAYTEWAKDNLLRVSHFMRGDQMADFANREAAERAISRSGLAGKAIVLQIKRGENRLVLSPSEAMKRGLWAGDGDKRITLSADFGKELVNAIGRRAKGKVSIPWALESAAEGRKRLEGMGIYTPSEFRAALREFAGLREAPATPSKVKELERAMIGRRNDGLDFFPTGEDAVDSMLDAAEVEPDMEVLEPSAGMGHIADAIRERAGVDPDVVELSSDRRELLEAKGHSVVGHDFMDMGGKQYDRIIMNPPFSKGRDIEHVRHAYSLLKPGGRLVSLMGEGAFFHDNKAAEGFRAWLDELGATSEKLPEGSFMDPSLPVNTGVNARMVVIDKPASEAAPRPADDERDAAHAATRREQDKAGTPSDRAVMEAVREGLGARAILQQIAGTSRSRFNKQIARLLLKTGVAPKVIFGETDLGAGDGFKFLAKYSRKDDALTLTDGAQGQAEQIFLHEMMHAATLRALDRKGIFAIQMKKLFEHVKKQGGANGAYGMKNVGEFVAEAFTNPEFQRALRQMDAPPGNSLKSAWDSFVRILRAILGLSHDGHDALSQALEIGVNVMREDMALRHRGRAAGVGDAYAQSAATRTSFDARIDALFNGAKAVVGTRVLDRSDVMGLLGYPGAPLMLNESHLRDGLTKHPEMTAAAWKKVPGWIENPAMAYRSLDPKHPGRIIIVAPELLAGHPVVMAIEPNPGVVGGKPGQASTEQLLVTVFAKTTGVVPAAVAARQGRLLYLNKQNAQLIGRGGGVQFPKHDDLSTGRTKILTEKNLAGWRKANAGEAYAGRHDNLTDEDRKLAALFGGALERPGAKKPGPADELTDADLVPQPGNPTKDEASGGQEDDAFYGTADLSNLKSTVLDQINKTFSHPGKVNWWHKTVGTMRNLAERNPSFKPVFDSAQRFIDDVSTLANDAADMAPRLLPRVETWRDLFKKPVSAEDNKGVARPLFEGTLMWARDLDGKPIKTDDLTAKYKDLTAEEKAEKLLKAGKIDPDMLRVWRGQPEEMFAKAVGTRFENKMLKAGVVWTDAELKSLFNATPNQISLYREARQAIDRSIDMTARADMLRAVGEEYAQLRDVMLDQPDVETAAQFLLEHLEQDARADFDNRDRLATLMQQVKNRLDQAQDLQKSGYAPLQRFGKYTVDVVAPDGTREYFGMFESMREANQMKLRMQDAFKGYTVTSGTMSVDKFKLFAGITPESLEMFGNMLGLQGEGAEAQDKAFQEYLKLAKNNHSALKRLIHRKGIAGYSEDVGRVLASFVYSNSRLGAGGLNAGTLDRAINDIPKEEGELSDVAMALRDYIQNPQEEGQAVRGMLFAQYLGGSVASAMVNMTQPFQITMPFLSQYGGMKQAAAQMARAVKDMANKNAQFEPDLAKALHHAEEDGVVSPQEIHQLMAQARGAGTLRSGDGTKMGDARAKLSNLWERGKVLWGQPFALAEQFNRRSTFIAAYRIAKAQGMTTPEQFARRAVLETQFVYSKANKPKWARGAIGGTLFTFKTYSVSYLELMNRMWTQGGPEGKRAVAWAVAMLLLMGGTAGLPFMEDLEDLIDAAGQLMGYNISSKQWRQELLADVVGKEMGGFMEQGLSGLPGMPVDVSGRMGMGNLIPGTGLMLTKQDHTRDLLEIAGPAGDLAARAGTAARDVLTGDVGGAAMQVAPTAVRNLVKGADMATSGMYKDQKGYKVIDTTLDEALAKAIGFQPKSVAQAQEASGFMMRSKAFYNQTHAEIAAQWADALFRKDSDAVQVARDRLAAWNRDNPDQRMVIRMPDIWKRVRQMGEDRNKRIADTAPKALRQQMKDMAAG